MSAPFSLTKENWYIAEKLDELRLAFVERFTVREPAYWWPTGFASKVSKNKGVEEYPTFPFGRYTDTEPLAFDNTYGWRTGDGTINDTLQMQSPAVSPQAYRFWHLMQQFCGTYGYMLYDSGYSPASGKEFFESIGGGLYLDSNNWGFRRSASVDAEGKPVIEYGTAKEGDILGAWLVDDLIACFNKMTCLYSSFAPEFRSGISVVKGSYPSGPDTCTFTIHPTVKHGTKAILGVTLYVPAGQAGNPSAYSTYYSPGTHSINTPYGQGASLQFCPWVARIDFDLAGNPSA